jgi:hypothetical protein
MQLGYWLEAEKHLTEGLATDKDPWIWKNRATIEASLAHARAAIGEIMVTGPPPGAVVLVNGKVAGTLPLTAPIRAAEGPAHVEVLVAGHQPVLRSFSIVGGRREEIAILMDGPKGAFRSAGEGGHAATTPDQRQRTSQGWRWTGVALGGAGIVGLVAGLLYVRAAQGCGEVPLGAVCNRRKNTVPGWALAGAGAATTVLGGVLFFRNREVQLGLAVRPEPRASAILTAGGSL